MSLPVRGAWIEIRKYCNTRPLRLGRSPCGERGLKYRIGLNIVRSHPSLPVRGAWIEILRVGHNLPVIDVAPRAGSVD